MSIPITDVILEDLGPNRAEVLAVVAPRLGLNYLGVVRRLKEGPILLAIGESVEVFALVRWLRERGARVTWTDHDPGLGIRPARLEQDR